MFNFASYMVLLISVGQNMCGSMYFHGCLHVYSVIYLVLCVCLCVIRKPWCVSP